MSGWDRGLVVRLDHAEYQERLDGIPDPPSGSRYLVLFVEMLSSFVGDATPWGDAMGSPVAAGYRADQFSAVGRRSAALRIVDPPLATGLAESEEFTGTVRGEVVFVVPVDEAVVTVRFTIRGTNGGYAWSVPGPVAGISVISAPTPRPPATPRSRPTPRPSPTATLVPAVPARVGESVDLDDLSVTLRTAEYAEVVAGLASPSKTVWLLLDLELRTLGTFMVPHRTAWLTAVDGSGRDLAVEIPGEGGLEDGGVRANTEGEPATVTGRIAVAVPVGATEVTVGYLAFAGGWGAASWTLPGPAIATPDA